jgi:hypothetical protein
MVYAIRCKTDSYGDYTDVEEEVFDTMAMALERCSDLEDQVYEMFWNEREDEWIDDEFDKRKITELREDFIEEIADNFEIVEFDEEGEEV